LSITHSIPETSALVVKTPLGTVFHTADWKFDDDPIIGIISNKKRIAEIGDMGVLACVCDSTNAMDKGKTGSEADILEPLTKEIIKAKGRVAITTFASNAGRLKTILRAVRDSGRQAVLCGRSMDRIFNIGREMGFFNEIPDPITMKQAIETEKNKIAYICTGSQGEGRAALWRIAGGGHPLPLEAGDTVIFSSKTIPGNEKDVSRLQNVLSERGVLIITSKDAHIHVSGHPAQDDLTEMYKLVRPEIAVPVHGEARHMLVHSQLAHKIGIQKSIVPKNGMVVKLAPHGPQAINMVDVGRLYVDGNLIDADNNATHERRRAMFSGVVHIGLILENGDFASEPAIFTFGVPNLETYKGQSHKDVLSEIIFHAFYNMDDHENVKEEVITETVRLAVRRHLNQYWGKKPHVEVSILYVNAPKFAKKKKAKKVQLIK
jgi:ribonuclease J